MTERLTERLTERKKDGQGESSIAPLDKVDCMELEVDTPIKIVYMSMNYSYQTTFFF